MYYTLAEFQLKWIFSLPSNNVFNLFCDHDQTNSNLIMILHTHLKFLRFPNTGNINRNMIQSLTLLHQSNSYFTSWQCKSFQTMSTLLHSPQPFSSNLKMWSAILPIYKKINHMGKKGENAGYHSFLPYQIQKSLFCWVISILS